MPPMNLSQKCYFGAIGCHLLAIPIVWWVSDPLLRALIVIYVINETQVHLDSTSKWFHLWGRFVVLSFFAYVSYRFFSHPVRDSRWYRALGIFIGWAVIELLYSQSFGWYPNTPGKTPKICYEIVIHLFVWVSLVALLYLQPHLRQPLTKKMSEQSNDDNK